MLKISKFNKEQVVPDPAKRKTESAEEVTTIAYARNVSYPLFCVVNRRLSTRFENYGPADHFIIIPVP